MKPSVIEIAEEARSIHSRLLADAVGTREMAGSCLHASVLLASMLINFGDCLSAVVRGGDGLGDGGYRDASGKWHGHYWVEVLCSTGVVVADITADQFWGPAIVVVPLADARGYVAGNQTIVDGHIAEQISSAVN